MTKKKEKEELTKPKEVKKEVLTVKVNPDHKKLKDLFD